MPKKVSSVLKRVRKQEHTPESLFYKDTIRDTNNKMNYAQYSRVRMLKNIVRPLNQAFVLTETLQLYLEPEIKPRLKQRLLSLLSKCF